MSQPPPCAACGLRYDDCHCDPYVWPGTITADLIGLQRAVADLWSLITEPFARLLDRIVRRR